MRKNQTQLVEAPFAEPRTCLPAVAVWVALVLALVAGCSTGLTLPWGPERSRQSEEDSAVKPPTEPTARLEEEFVGPPELEGPPEPPARAALQEPMRHGEALEAPSSRRAPDSEAALLSALAAVGFDTHPSSRGVVVLMPDAVFEFGSAELTREAGRKVREVGRVIVERADGRRIAVEGHTDSIGADLYNQGLSERRAVAVARELAAAGVPASLLERKGYGARFPIAPNAKSDGSDDPGGRARNRRVEVIVERPGELGR